MPFLIIATTHHLSEEHGNTNTALFGRYASLGEHDYLEASRAFATLTEAEEALAELKSRVYLDPIADYEIVDIT